MMLLHCHVSDVCYRPFGYDHQWDISELVLPRRSLSRILQHDEKILDDFSGEITKRVDVLSFKGYKSRL